MKTLMSMVAALVAVSGWSGVSALDLPGLCGDLKVLSDPDTRVYRGRSEQSGVTLDIALVVVEVSISGQALVFYVHGAQPLWNIPEENCFPWHGQVSTDRTLTVNFPNRATGIFTFDREGGASMEYYVQGFTTPTRGTLTLDRTSLPRQHDLPLVMEASNTARQGFVRIINRSDRDGTVDIHAIDDTGERYGPIRLEMDAKETVHFNSVDLEEGNEEKGLHPGVGDREGNWRLQLDTDLDIKPLAYIRTEDGFVTSIHDTAVETREGGSYDVPFVNPGKNLGQQSRLRLINPGAGTAEIEITGLDDDGEPPPEGAVQISLPAGAATMLTAAELEQGAEHFTGRFGAGTGKWQLSVSSNRPIQVMSLLLSPTGNLTNLSR